MINCHFHISKSWKELWLEATLGGRGHCWCLARVQQHHWDNLTKASQKTEDLSEASKVRRCGPWDSGREGHWDWGKEPHKNVWNLEMECGLKFSVVYSSVCEAITRFWRLQYISGFSLVQIICKYVRFGDNKGKCKGILSFIIEAINHTILFRPKLSLYIYYNHSHLLGLMPLYFRMKIPNPKVTIIGYKWFAINLSSSHSFNANIFSPLPLCPGPGWCRAGDWRQLIVCIYHVSIMYLSCIYHVSIMYLSCINPVSIMYLSCIYHVLAGDITSCIRLAVRTQQQQRGHVLAVIIRPLSTHEVRKYFPCSYFT